MYIQVFIYRRVSIYKDVYGGARLYIDVRATIYRHKRAHMIIEARTSIHRGARVNIII